MTKRNKTQRIKMDKYETEEQLEVKNFIKILIILIIIVLGVYFFTRIFVTKDLFNKDKNEETHVEGKIDYNKTIIGAMLTRPEEEYYVIIYNNEDITGITYNGIVSNYSRNENALKIYTVDLKSELNKKYVAETESEENLKDLENFKVYESALVKVSHGSITKTFADEDAISEELKYLNTTSN